MDHETFHSMEIDALYDELDAASSAAIHVHAASCTSCNARFERLRVARRRGLSVLADAVPEDFESRIMAAVDAALAKRAGARLVPVSTAGAGGSNADAGANGDEASPGPAGPPRAVAKVIPFFARPSFAVAATLILVLGAAAILTQTSMAKKAAPMAMGDSVPAIAAASGAPSSPGAPGLRGDGTGALSPAEETAMPVVSAIPARDAPMASVALNQRVAADPSPPPMAGPAAPKPAARPSKPMDPGALGGKQDAAFAAAKSLYDAGRYTDALPRFEAIKANHPEAELYAARCIMRTRGCAAATSRFDAAAQNNSGTEIGSRARIEGAKCYQQIGEAQAARTRYQAAKDEGFLAREATVDLEALDRPAPAPAATTSPGTPVGGKASPKRAAEPSLK